MTSPNQRGEGGGIISTLVSLIFLVVLVGGIYLARHPLLRFAGEELVAEDPLEKSDAIIVLSDDNFYADRATRAVSISIFYPYVHSSLGANRFDSSNHGYGKGSKRSSLAWR